MSFSWSFAGVLSSISAFHRSPFTNRGSKKDFENIDPSNVDMRQRFFQISAHEGHAKAIGHKARCEAEASGHKLPAAEMRKRQEKEDRRMERTIAKFWKKRTAHGL